MSYTIFLDTNIVYNDFFFKSSDMKRMLRFIKDQPVELCITEFNFNEIIKKYRDKIRPVVKQVKGAKGDLIRLNADELVNQEFLKSDFFVEKYRENLRDIIDENNIEIVPYPVSKDLIRKISTKYFNEEKPFGYNKQSFQDAIIWESIVEYCKAYYTDKVIFISDNHKDFAGPDKLTLHQDLAKDVNNLIYYKSLESFLENEREYLKEYFQDMFEYDELDLPLKIKDFIEKNNLLQYSIDELLMNSHYEGDFISGWGTDGDIDQLEITLDEVILDVEENTILIKFSVEVEVSFSIETVDPTYEKGDSGDGMISEPGVANFVLTCNISYARETEKLFDYIEIEIDNT